MPTAAANTYTEFASKCIATIPINKLQLLEHRCWWPVHLHHDGRLLSSTQACQNVNDQIPNTELSEVVQDSETACNSQVLSKITTTSTKTTHLELLYTSLYFMNLLPTYQTKENPG